MLENEEFTRDARVYMDPLTFFFFLSRNPLTYYIGIFLRAFVLSCVSMGIALDWIWM